MADIQWRLTITIDHSCYRVVLTSWRDQMGPQEHTGTHQGKKVLRRCSGLYSFTLQLWFNIMFVGSEIERFMVQTTSNTVRIDFPTLLLEQLGPGPSS